MARSSTFVQVVSTLNEHHQDLRTEFDLPSALPQTNGEHSPPTTQPPPPSPLHDDLDPILIELAQLNNRLLVCLSLTDSTASDNDDNTTEETELINSSIQQTPARLSLGIRVHTNVTSPNTVQHLEFDDPFNSSEQTNGDDRASSDSEISSSFSEPPDAQSTPPFHRFTTHGQASDGQDACEDDCDEVPRGESLRALRFLRLSKDRNQSDNRDIEPIRIRRLTRFKISAKQLWRKVRGDKRVQEEVNANNVGDPFRPLPRIWRKVRGDNCTGEDDFHARKSSAAATIHRRLDDQWR